jgi:hypothetical protein
VTAEGFTTEFADYVLPSEINHTPITERRFLTKLRTGFKENESREDAVFEKVGVEQYHPLVVDEEYDEGLQSLVRNMLILTGSLLVIVSLLRRVMKRTEDASPFRISFARLAWYVLLPPLLIFVSQMSGEWQYTIPIMPMTIWIHAYFLIAHIFLIVTIYLYAFVASLSSTAIATVTIQVLYGLPCMIGAVVTQHLVVSSIFLTWRRIAGKRLPSPSREEVSTSPPSNFWADLSSRKGK